MKSFFHFSLIVLLLSSCVPARKLEDAQTRISSLQAEIEKINKVNAEKQYDTEALSEQIDEMQKQIKKLISDTSYYGERYRKVAALNEHLNELYDKVIAQNEKLLSSSTSEKNAMSDSLYKRQNQLMKKELELNDLQKDLMEREQQLNELKKILREKDSITQLLKSTITEALIGFEKSDLTIEEKDGRIYVSMADKLLFKSGSVAVDAKGQEAIQKLAEVLKKNRDISIVVEGHTDNVPLSGSGAMKDNWDLSVLRATSIVRLLVQHGVDPEQVVASGKGEFQPVESNATTEGKAKNRRSEIIISPKLNELLKIVGDH